MKAYSVYIILCTPLSFFHYLKENENAGKFRKRTLHFVFKMTS